MEKKQLQLARFNAWVGLIIIVAALIASPIPVTPTFLYLINYDLYLQTNHPKAVVTEIEITIFNRGSRIKIETDNGVFYFNNREFFDKITEELKTAEYIEIWYNERNRMIIDIRVNQSEFVIQRDRIAFGFVLFVLIFIGTTLGTATIVIIKTKGWGSYSLLEKYPKGLLWTIFK